MDPLVSIIIPVYKVEPYLRECVDSVLNQSYQNLEIILVDDGSPDNCPAICDEYAERDSRVKVIHKENGGLSDARNAGLKQVTGSYVMFVDSDDWIDKELIYELVSQMPYSLAIFGCTITEQCGSITNVVSTTKENKVVQYAKEPEYMKRVLISSLLGYVCNKIYQREILLGESFSGIRDREDLVFNLNLLKKVDCFTLSKQNGYFYRQHESSLLHRSFNEAVPDYMRTVEALIDAFEGLSTENREELCNYALKAYLIDVIHRYINSNSMLDKSEKKKEMGKLFASEKIRKKLSLRYNACMMHWVLAFCYKFRLINFFRIIYSIADGQSAEI